MIANKRVWLVSGANRGIGFNIVNILSQRENVVIFAGARDPTAATQLNELAAKNSNLHVIKLTSTSEEDAKAAAKKIEEVSVILYNGMTV